MACREKPSLAKERMQSLAHVWTAGYRMKVFRKGLGRLFNLTVGCETRREVVLIGFPMSRPHVQSTLRVDLRGSFFADPAGCSDADDPLITSSLFFLAICAKGVRFPGACSFLGKQTCGQQSESGFVICRLLHGPCRFESPAEQTPVPGFKPLWIVSGLLTGQHFIGCPAIQIVVWSDVVVPEAEHVEFGLETVAAQSRLAGRVFQGAEEPFDAAVLPG